MKERTLDERWWEAADRDPIHLAAADWYTRLRDPAVSLDDTLAWQNWVNGDPRHAAAFARIEELSDVLRSLPRPPRPQSSKFPHDGYDASVPIREWHGSRTRIVAIAASVILAAIALAWTMKARAPLLSSGAQVAALETLVGENRTVTLADGSFVTLGGATKVEVALDKEQRRLTLARGEAFFTVAKDPTRPFKVRAGDATVVAVGTGFNVRRRDDRIEVTVVEGRVIVEPASRFVPIALLREIKPSLAPVRLDAGQKTTVNAAGIGAAVELPDPSAATAWQTGHLAFRLQPLSYVLEDVNRYASKPIVVQDERVASLKVTGTVMANNVKGWIGSLENAFSLQATEEPDRIVLKPRR